MMAAILRLWLVLLLFLPASAALAQRSSRAPVPLERRIEQLLRGAGRSATWGVQVVDVADGRVLFAHHGDSLLVPASGLKLLTTAAALDALGPAFRYRTTLFLRGEVRNRALYGDLVVRGAGDPTFGSRFVYERDRTLPFRQWADSLRARGIRRVEGRVVGDDDVFDDEPIGAGWLKQDLPYWFAPEISGLAFHDNLVDFSIRGTRDGSPGQVSMQPATNYVRVVNRTRTVDTTAAPVADFTRLDGTNTVWLAHAMSPGGTERASLTVTNPTLFFTHVLRETLARRGIRVRGAAADVDDLDERPSYEDGRLRLAAIHESPPLAEIVRIVNKHSWNPYAEHLLKTIAARRTLGRPGSARLGALVAKGVFAHAGIDTTRLRMADGSGLSRDNAVSPAMMTTLLRYMWAHPDSTVREAFLASLPVGGVDGTLRGRFHNRPAKGNVRAKTGTMHDVSSLSGFVRTADGRTLAFSLICNGIRGDVDRAEAVEDAVVTLLARSKGDL